MSGQRGRFKVPAHLKDDPRVQELLAKYEQGGKDNPLWLYNDPEGPGKFHEKQYKFNLVQAPPLGIKAMIAGNRSGKTYCCCADDVIQLVRREYVPPHLLPAKKFDAPCHIWVGAPKLSKHADTIVPLFRRLIPKAELKDGSFDKSYSAQERIIRLNSGSTIGLKTYDQDTDAWASAAVHRIHWDEEPNNARGRDLRSEARGRLVSTGGDEILGMTPILGISTWANDDVYERRDDPAVTVMSMSMSDNPWNDPLAIRAYLEGLTDEERRAREHGEFVHFGGVFFPEFRASLHQVKPPEKENISGQEIVVSIDPGLVNTAVIWSAWDSDNAGIVFAEHFPSTTDVPEIAAEIRKRNREWGIKTEPSYIIDPSYRNLTTRIHSDAVQANYAREGIFVAPGNHDRRSGIMEIWKRLRAKTSKGEPSPTLLISEDCPELVKQIVRYRRDPNAADEWQAVPQDSHTRFDLVDAMRYGVMSRTWMIPETPEYVTPQYEYGVEPPYNEQDFVIDAPPMGDQS
ncbi:MAG: hypothetical protein JST59_23720 [Actinobacteria bacterium]|nr:hypothetical protein [Actinomycetota bacterium]